MKQLTTNLRKSVINLRKSNQGFSLVELMVVIAILAILFVVILLTLDPTRSLKKARDAQRKSDLQQIRNALDTYYNDNNCYPQNLDKLTSPTVYIKKIPLDPLCLSKGEGYCYVYLVNSDESCPQWSALFAHLEINGSIYNENGMGATCPIISACGFGGSQSYNANLNLCIFLGNLDCDVAGNSTLYPTGYGFVPTATPAPSATPAPTPTPLPCTPERQKYKCTRVDVGVWVCSDVGSPLEGGDGKYCTTNCNNTCGNL